MQTIRISAVVLAFSLLAAPVYAQGVRLGIKGGLASSTVYGDAIEDDEAESLTRFAGGVFMEFGVAPLLSIQPELILSLKGASFVDQGGGDDSGNVRLAYIEVPVLAKITLGGAPLRPSIFAGPAVAFNTSCEVEFDVIPGAKFDCGNEEADVIDNESTEFSAIFGVGLAQSLGLIDFVLDGRYNVGLSSAFDDDDAIKNRASRSSPVSASRWAACDRDKGANSPVNVAMTSTGRFTSVFGVNPEFSLPTTNDCAFDNRIRCETRVDRRGHQRLRISPAGPAPTDVVTANRGSRSRARRLKDDELGVVRGRAIERGAGSIFLGHRFLHVRQRLPTHREQALPGPVELDNEGDDDGDRDHHGYRW